MLIWIIDNNIEKFWLYNEWIFFFFLSDIEQFSKRKVAAHVVMQEFLVHELKRTLIMKSYIGGTAAAVDRITKNYIRFAINTIILNSIIRASILK